MTAVIRGWRWLGALVQRVGPGLTRLVDRAIGPAAGIGQWLARPDPLAAVERSRPRRYSAASHHSGPEGDQATPARPKLPEPGKKRFSSL